MRNLTPTSYAILGLLHLRPFTAYELATQSQRSLRFVWPTSPSQLYAEAKRLADDGLVAVSEQAAGPSRTRQQYRITAAGRRALRSWHRTEPAQPRLEAEVLLRVLLGDAADPADLLAAVDRTRAQLVELNEAGRALLDTYAAGSVEFPERLHLNLLWIVLVRDLLQLLHDWTGFAADEIGSWSDAEDRGDTASARALLERIVGDEPVLSRRPIPRRRP